MPPHRQQALTVMRGERLLLASMRVGAHLVMSTTPRTWPRKRAPEWKVEGRVVELLLERLDANGDAGQRVDDE
jgi:hypothetical protein